MAICRYNAQLRDGISSELRNILERFCAKSLWVPLGLTANALALRLRVSAPRLHAILHGKRSIAPDTAMRLGRCFGTSAQMWLNMQQLHDLTKAQQVSGKKIEREVEPLKMSLAA